VDDVVELQNIRGLTSAEEPHTPDLDADARYFEAVVGPQSPLVGRTLNEVGFRGRYQAVVLAIHRAGQRVDAKLGQVTLRVGDALLVLTDSGFRERWRDRGDFLVIWGRSGSRPVPGSKAAMVWVITGLMILAASTGLLPILEASLLAAVLLIAVGALSPGEARAAVDLDVILVIASAFGMAAAMEASGLARMISDGLVGASSVFGEKGVLIGITVATVILTALITNNAAALLMFPVAVSAAATTGVDLRALAVTITIAASVDFLTPIGYQTNTMVYGPGGYRFLDYTRLGAPLTAFVMAMLLVFVPIFWPL